MNFGFTTLGMRRTLAELLTEAESDRVWYDAIHSGVTLSGGEPCAQPRFALEFLAQCRKRALHTAPDTCVQVPPQVFEDILDQWI